MNLIFVLIGPIQSRYTVFSTVTRHGLDSRGLVIWFPARAKDFPLLQSVQNAFGIQLYHF